MVGRSVGTKPNPDSEDPKLPFASPPSPASALVRKPVKIDAPEPIYDTVLVLMEPSSIVLDGNAKAETDADAEGGALPHE